MKFQHSEGRKGTGFVFMAILTSLLSTVVFVRFAYAVGVLGFAGSDYHCCRTACCYTILFVRDEVFII